MNFRVMQRYTTKEKGRALSCSGSMLEHKLDVNRLEEAGTQLKLLPVEENARIPTEATLHPSVHMLRLDGFLRSCLPGKSFHWLGIMCHLSVPQYLILNYETIFSQNSFYRDECVCIHISHVGVLRYSNERTC